MKSLLLLGPRYHKSGKRGGVVVSFELLVEDLVRSNAKITVIDTNKQNYCTKFFAYTRIMSSFLQEVFKHRNVSLHGTAMDFIYIAPVVVFVSRVLGRCVVLRKFAGSFIDVYESSSYLRQKLIAFALRRSDALLWETEYLVRYFSKFNSDSHWFPNSRPKPCQYRDPAIPYRKRFIFLGYIREEKGMDIMLQASLHLDISFSIDVYGTTVDEKYADPELWDRYPVVSYRGPIEATGVYDTLADHDILLLPSHWEGEGYPGVVIEALAIGLPVIASDLPGIKEILKHDKAGFLIEPKNPGQLVEAMKTFNERNYLRFCENARHAFAPFESKKLARRFTDLFSALE